MKQKIRTTHKLYSTEAGQTMIETIVAIFLLLTALSGGLALSLYSLQTSETSFDQIVATNLAREGIDVIRMMRDTNWLEGHDNGGNDDLDLDCGDSSVDGGPTIQDNASESIMDGKACYVNWLTDPAYDFNHNALNANDHRLCLGSCSAATTTSGVWTLDRRNGSETFHLCQDSNGFFRHSSACDGNSNPPFARRVRVSMTIDGDSSPYTPSNPLILVESIVVWSGKRCAPIDNINPASVTGKCKIVVQEYLTNWKDYE